MSTPVLPPSLVKPLLELFATVFIGFTVSTTIYGITVLQGYIYFRNYSNDHTLMKITVAVLLVLDTLSTLLVAHSLYTYHILNFINVLDDFTIPWSFCLENGVVAVITVIVQSYFADRLWRFSHNYILVAAIGLFSAASLGLSVWTTAHLFITPTIASLADRDFLVIGGLVQGHAAVCDVLITIGLCYYLYRARTGVRTTEHVIDSLMIYSVNRGALTTITQIMFLVLYVGLPSRTIWQPFHQAVGKLYVNSLLATLNARKSLQGPSSECCCCEGNNFKSIHISRLGHDSEQTEPTAQQNSNFSGAKDGSSFEHKVLPLQPDLATPGQA